MSAATVTVSSVDPYELEAELAIAVSSESEGLRINGAQLNRVKSAVPDAAPVWLLDDGEGAWSLVGRVGESWQVVDIFWCLNHADLVTRVTPRDASSWLELLVVPMGEQWIVVEADPQGERELGLCADPGGVVLWGSRADARLAAERRATVAHEAHAQHS